MENPLPIAANFPLQGLAAAVFFVHALVGTAFAGSEPVEPPRPSRDNVRPAYPHPHGLVHGRATVTLRFVVDRDGSVVDPQVVDGADPFASAALRAVKLWKYEPARQNGQAISTPWETRIRFELPSQERDRWSIYRGEKRGFSSTLVTGAAAATSAPATK